MIYVLCFLDFPWLFEYKSNTYEDGYSYTCVDFGGSSRVCNGDVTFSSGDGDSVGSWVLWYTNEVFNNYSQFYIVNLVIRGF